MLERPDAREDGPLVRIDATVFESLSAPGVGGDTRMQRWLATWAGRDR